MKSNLKVNFNFNNQTKRLLLLSGAILVLTAIFTILAPGFFTLNNFLNIIRQNASLALVAMGVTFIIMLASPDISTGANMAFGGAVGALFVQAMVGEGVASGLNMALLAMAVTIIACMVVGAINGLMVGRFGVNPFMTTLAMMSLARGMTLYITDARRVLMENPVFNWFGQANIVGNVPASLLLVIGAFIFAQIMLTRTKFGRHTLAVGGNPVAARASGVGIRMHKAKVFLFASFFVGLAAIVAVGRAVSAHPLAGMNMEFNAITAVVIGGTSLMGGAGTIVGTLLGAFLIGLIFTGIGNLMLSPFLTYVVQGLLIIVAVLLDQSSNRVREKRTKRVKVESADSQQLLASLKAGTQEKLELRSISKTFPGVRALDDVSFSIKRGSVHALCGENGAGKSTLMKVLSGVYSADEGGILIDDVPVNIRSPIDSQKLGISVIYQEFALVQELSITQNIFMGKELKRGPFLRKRDMKRKTRELLDRLQLKVQEQRRIADCTVGQMQMVEIAKAISSDAWIIVMDEPTAAITEHDKERLFELVHELKAQGMAIVYITHRLSEIFEIADEITVLRDGKTVFAAPVEEIDEGDIIRHMVGREITDVFYRKKFEPGEVVLEVKDLLPKGNFEPISFTVRAGEVLGFSGLMGSGRTEIARCIFGLDKTNGGEIYLEGKKLDINSPSDAIKHGIGYVSEDRRREGIVPLLSVRENITMARLPHICHLGFINRSKDKEISENYIDLLSIRTPSTEQTIGNLSGGNQQKVCLSKWMCCEPKVIILDEPTRGIDVGAKAEISKLIEALCERNLAVIMISSELIEILGLSDRIIVLREGKVTGKFDDLAEVDQEVIMTAAATEAE